MDDVELAFRLGQVAFAALIATIPPLYPNHSLYTRFAFEGIEKLYEIDEESEEYSVGWVEDGERGFHQLHQAIDSHRPLKQDAERFGLLYVESRQQLNDYLDSYYGASVDPNFAFFVEYADGSREPLICHPFDPNQTRRLTELREWIRNKSTIRSNYLTAMLAIFWTAIAIATTVVF
jgi:hypothetical protein